MLWKVKAFIQNAASRLPEPIAYAVYFRLQRTLGSLRNFNPVQGLGIGIQTWERLQGAGFDPTGKVFYEIGTGRVPLAPLAYWLMGARETVTIDRHPYLSDELLSDSLRYIRDNAWEIRRVFGPLLDEERFRQLLETACRTPYSRSGFLGLCRIEYVAPGDAACTTLPSGYVDFCTSNTVLEHIPPEVLRKILNENNRITKHDGAFIHRIDYTDHFSHSDKSISRINFLRYSRQQWKQFVRNRFMYMNRLRHDDFVQMFQEAGHTIVEDLPDLDHALLDGIVSRSVPISDTFRGKGPRILAITGAWILSRKKEALAVSVLYRPDLPRHRLLRA